MSTSTGPEPGPRLNLYEEDRLPLPDQRAKNRDTIDRSYSGTNAEPRTLLRVRMDHNDIDGRWMFTAGIADRGTVISRKPAMLWHPYEFRNRYLFMFIDPFGGYERVTARNLGDPVFLIVIPGPESPGYTDWYADRFGYETATDDGDSATPEQPIDRILF